MSGPTLLETHKPDESKTTFCFCYRRKVKGVPNKNLVVKRPQKVDGLRLD